MIRLTELTLTDQVVRVKIEGYLTEASLKVLDEMLVEYAQRDIRQVHFMADGLLSVDRHALRECQDRFPQALDLSFYTSRIALQHLLHSCGFEVFLQENV